MKNKLKILAGAVALASLAAVAPAYADGANPVENAVKDRQMMTTGRYELPGARSYERAARRAYVRNYGYAAPYGGYDEYEYDAPRPVYGGYPSPYSSPYYGASIGFGYGYPAYGYLD